MKNNIETVKSIYDAFGKGDVPGILEHLSENVLWEPWEENYAQKAGVPWLLERKGKDGVREFFRIIGGFVFREFRVLSVMGGGNKVAAECLFDADIPTTGGHIKEDEIHLWTFDDHGKVIEYRHYCDTAKHIAAAKLNN